MEYSFPLAGLTDGLVCGVGVGVGVCVSNGG